MPRRTSPPTYADPAARDLFSFLRIACAMAADMPIIPSVRDGRAGFDPISKANELRVLATLLASCEQSLQRFDTSLEQDVALLSGDELPRNARNCVLMRAGEKHVLQQYIGFLEWTLPLLRGWNPSTDPPQEAKERFGGYLAVVIDAMRAPGSR